MATTQRIKRNGLADQVIDRVRELIVDGTYPVGSRLPAEPELSSLFGVGRSTIREAMRVLANRSIVEIRHGEGTFVTAAAPRESIEERLAHAELAELYEARRVLELPFAELAAERRSSRDVAAMRTALKKRDRAMRSGNVADYIESDFAFHLAVARAAKNSALLSVYESLVEAVKPLLASALTSEYLVEEHDRLHGDLCEAIADGDVKSACKLALSHLERSHSEIDAQLT